jgi:hypothetical protein
MTVSMTHSIARTALLAAARHTPHDRGRRQELERICLDPASYVESKGFTFAAVDRWAARLP